MILSTTDTPIFTEPDDVYFASGAIGSTEARKVLLSPQLFRDHRDGLIPHAETAAFAFGHAWDGLLSTRKAFNDLFTVRPPDVDLRTKAGKEWREQAQASGKRIVTTEDADALRRMRERMDPRLLQLVESLPAQQIVRVLESGWAMQAKADLVCLDRGLIIDIKTTSKPLESWDRSAFDYGYPFQAGWYRRAFREATGELFDFAFVVSESIAPWRTRYFAVDQTVLDYGDTEARRAAEIITERTASGDWTDPGRDGLLLLPRWLRGDE